MDPAIDPQRVDPHKSAAGTVFSIQRAPASRICFREPKKIEAGPEDLPFIYLDMSCQPGKTYRYRVVYRPAFGAACILSETGEHLAVAVPTTLRSNHPNPFSTVTALRFSVDNLEEIDFDSICCGDYRYCTILQIKY